MSIDIVVWIKRSVAPLQASRTVFGLLAATAVLLGAVLAVAAPADAAERHAAFVIDANTGSALHADMADEPRYPASLTKIMTIYMAFEAIEQGRTSFATRLKVSQEAASAAPTKLDLDPGETIALIDAIKALITKSANDAAVVIAEHLGGTESRFARMMTDKARLFGMSRTTFRNASGLPDADQVTTARDMATLALRVQDDFPKHYQLFSLRAFTYDGSSYRNHNNLLFRFQGTDGMKTGYTRASGFNLVASVRRGGRHVVGVVLGGRTASRRDDAMQLLLSRALMQAAPYRSRKSAPVLVAVARPAQRPVVVARAEPTPQPRTVAAAQPQSQPQAQASEPPRPRPVMVPQRPRPPATAVAQLVVPAPTPAIRPQMVSAAATVDSQPQRLAFAPAGMDPAGSWPAAIERGAPPSTLQQQAMALARAAEPAAAPPQPAQRTLPVPHGVRGPMPNSAAAPQTSGFEIQVGAFATAAEADRALAAARTSAGDLLRSSEGRAVAVKKDARQIFRARFAGFDSRTAASTCLELRRRQIDCFVMRAE